MRALGLIAGRLDRLSANERVLLASGLILLASLFFKWFGESFSVGDSPLGEVTASGWEALPWVRWVLLATALLAIGVPVAVAAGASLKLTIPSGVFVTIAGGLSYALILWRVVDPPEAYGERGLAAFVGLIASAVVAYVGHRSMEDSGITFRSAADRLSMSDRNRRPERSRRRTSPPPPPGKREKE